MGEFEAEDEDGDEDESCSLEEVLYSLHDDDDNEPGDVWLFMELLKQMLHLDPEERITPDQVLKHPFITTSHNQATSL